MKARNKRRKLSGRIKDWNDTVNRSKNGGSGYHKPGSTKK